MSGTGNCYDNAAMENFFGLLKPNGFIGDGIGTDRKGVPTFSIT